MRGGTTCTGDGNGGRGGGAGGWCSGGGAGRRVRRAGGRERHHRAGAHHDAGRLQRRRRALRDGVRVHRRGRGGRARSCRCPTSPPRSAGRRLDAAAPGPGGGAAGRRRAATRRCRPQRTPAGRRGHPRDPDRRPRHHRPERRRRRGGGVGRRQRVPADPRRPRGARLLRRAQPGVHGRPLRRRAGRRSWARGPATARRSWPPSPPTTPGCRCASSASGLDGEPARSRPTCSCSPTSEPAAAGRRRGPHARPQRAGATTCCSTTCAPTWAWSGCPSDMWLSYMTLEAPAGELDYDLAVSRPARRHAVARRRRRARARGDPRAAAGDGGLPAVAARRPGPRRGRWPRWAGRGGTRRGAASAGTPPWRRSACGRGRT